MAFPIPKIEYKNTTLAGNTTNTSAIVTGISSTASLLAGMFAKGTGIPTGAKILTVDSTTQVTLDKNATATASAVSIAFGVAIEFDYPPVEKTDEARDAKETVSEARDGTRQTSVSYIEVKRSFKFSFVSQSIKLLLDTFMESYALYGNTFRYFEDKSTTTYKTYELFALKYAPKKITPKGVEVYIWEIDSDFRRVL